MEFLKNQIIKACIIPAFMILSAVCSGTIGEMQDFKHNLYPEIISFTCDPDDSTSLDPNTPVLLTVEASDPESGNLKYIYSTEDGSFTDQEDSGNTSTVIFYSAQYLTTSQLVKVSVKVIDDHKFSVSQDLTIGSTREGPSITSISDIPEYISSNSETEYTFSANESGIYQFQVLSAGTYSASFDTSLASNFYGAGTAQTVTICGIDLSTSNIKMTSDTANEIALVFQDTLTHTTSKIFTLTVDDDPPVSSVNPASGTSTVLTAIPVTISATDSASGVSGICYTTDGSTPDFSGNGTAVSGNSAELTIGTDGTSGVGIYTLNYIVMDNCGNTEAVNTATYYINSDTTSMGPVTDLLVTQISANTIVVSYTLPSDTDFDHVLVQCSPASGSTVSNTSATTVCSINNLSADTEYTVTVYAVDTYNNNSTGAAATISTPTSSYSSLMNVYYIDDLNDLVTLQGDSGYWSYYCYLNADITITSASSSTIGNSTTAFEGYFAGNSHTISGLTISDSSTSYRGFFGYISAGTVRDLILSGVTVSGASNTGGLAGCVENSGVITNCDVSGTVSGSESAGGLTGYSSLSSVTDCSTTVTVSASNLRAGGLIGYNSSSPVTNCTSSANVSVSDSYAGVLIGHNAGSSASINNCTASGSVTADVSYGGGLIGSNEIAAVNNCSSSTEVYAYAYAGGLIGYNTGDITSCSVTGNTENSADYNGSDYAGGLIAYNTGNITDCYSTGTVIGRNGGTGGLIGYNTGDITGSYVSISGYAMTENTYNLAVRGVNAFTGGFVGWNYGGAITYCYAVINDTNIYTGSYTNAGGFAGYNNNGGTIECCFADVAVYGISSSNYYGGFIANNASGTVTNCYAKGNVVGGSSIYCGGFAGFNADSISYCYETGVATGASYVFGFVGLNNGSIQYSYYNTASNNTDSAATGVSLSDMLLQSTFSGWDFAGDSNGSNDYWSIGTLNEGYPYLTDNEPPQ